MDTKEDEFAGPVPAPEEATPEPELFEEFAEDAEETKQDEETKMDPKNLMERQDESGNTKKVQYKWHDTKKFKIGAPVATSLLTLIGGYFIFSGGEEAALNGAGGVSKRTR